uniref:Histidine acid phosphatase n=1 Tax=Strongyloides papillosus TaxID=174720 RepID=A0A0N5BG21_STREA
MKLFIFLFFTFCIQYAFSKELLLAQTIFRHGSRTPIYSYPNDVYYSSIWPVPLGQLLPLGMEQSFKQGLKLNHRYIHQYSLVSSSYNVNEITVRSSDVDRTLTSAYYNLFGFYINNTVKNNFLSTFGFKSLNTVPVHTVPFNEDYLLNVNVYCKKRENELKKQLERKEYHQYLSSKQHIINKIEKFSGFKEMNEKRINEFFDVIHVQNYNNFSLPTWITKGLYEDIRNLTETILDYVSGGGVIGIEENVELIKYSGGSLLNIIIKNMLEAIDDYENNITERKKYYVFSAHDSTLSALLRTLGAKQKLLGSRQPDYSAVLSLELWTDDNDKYFISLQYSDNEDKPFRDITELISDCVGINNMCTLDRFIERSKKYRLKIDEKKGESALSSFKQFCQL